MSSLVLPGPPDRAAAILGPHVDRVGVRRKPLGKGLDVVLGNEFEHERGLLGVAPRPLLGPFLRPTLDLGPFLSVLSSQKKRGGS